MTELSTTAIHGMWFSRRWRFILWSLVVRQGRTSIWGARVSLSLPPASYCFFLCLPLVSPKRQLTFIGQHAVISQEIELGLRPYVAGYAFSVLPYLWTVRFKRETCSKHSEKLTLNGWWAPFSVLGSCSHCFMSRDRRGWCSWLERIVSFHCLMDHNWYSSPCLWNWLEALRPSSACKNAQVPFGSRQLTVYLEFVCSCSD
jgi:hypothetical protein